MLIEGSGRRPLRPGSIRFRLTAIATLVVAGVLSSSAVALVVIQRQQLTANLDASLEQRADTIASSLVGDATIVNTNDEDRAVQIVDAAGLVVAATENLAGAPSLPNPLGQADTQAIRTSRDLPLEDDAYRVLTRRIDTDAGPQLLHVAENSDDLTDAIRALAVALAAAVPLVVAALAALMWWLTGRTLRPVDRIRTEVDAISTDGTTHRVRVGERDDEISRLAATMNRMLDRLSDASESQRRFVADAAHELRTPLTRIRTEVEVDLARPDRAEPIATNHKVLEEVDALQNLIDDLLHLARSDAGHGMPKVAPVDLDDIVLSEVRRLREAGTSATIDIRSVAAAHLMADPDAMARVVRNLLSNAARHAASRVTVTLAEHADVVELAVEDDGQGIALADTERIFERFTRLDDARARNGGGTGLGLAIARDVVERHGGSIRYVAGSSGGARFVIELPNQPEDG